MTGRRPRRGRGIAPLVHDVALGAEKMRAIAICRRGRTGRLTRPLLWVVSPGWGFDNGVTTLLLAFAGAGAAQGGILRLQSRLAARHRRLERVFVDACTSIRSREEMTRTGHVVRPDGVTTYEKTAEGLTRRDHPASTVTGVDVRAEDDDHVSVTVETVGGTVRMPWIRRSADALESLRVMAEAAASRSGNVPGRVYVVHPANEMVVEGDVLQ